jgi:HD-GYP domain-containing protein (c-di-GMP phosphodiesterase class II)
VLATLARNLELRDPSSRGHAARVTALAEVVALRLGWNEQRLETLRVGAQLHDIGKVVIPTSVLCKPGPLDDDELAQIRLHPAAGARLLTRVGAARAALPCVLYHHERWDGDGYPTGLAGDDIPVEARLLAAVDAFDAMTSVRPYRPALSPESAIEEVERCAGTQFDPQIAEALLDLITRASRASA